MFGGRAGVLGPQRGREPLCVRGEAALVETALVLKSAHNFRETERVAVHLLVAEENFAVALRAFDDSGAARALHGRGRVVSVAVDAEVNAFELSHRVCEFRLVRLLAAVERRVAAQAEGGRRDAPTPTRSPHVVDELVAAASKVTLEVRAPVLFEVHAVIREENDLGLRA